MDGGSYPLSIRFAWPAAMCTTFLCQKCLAVRIAQQAITSQRSLQNAPIFRLLLKVAVNGTHQCDFLNFCGALGPQQ